MPRACLLLQALQHELMANKVLATSVGEVRYFLVCEKNMWSLTVGMLTKDAKIMLEQTENFHDQQIKSCLLC